MKPAHIAIASGLVLVLLVALIIFRSTGGFESRPAERAISGVRGAMEQLSEALETYRDRHGSYPAAYGYIRWEARGSDPGAPSPSEYYVLSSYLETLDLYGELEVYDPYSDSYDADLDGQISLLEFSPPDGETDKFYNGENFPLFTQNLINASPRPFIYAPVNLSDFNIAREYWMKTEDYDVEWWNAVDADMGQVRFPPPEYDAYVLISAGPDGSTFGVVPNDIVLPRNVHGHPRPHQMYHVAAMRTYFLATRDLNDNGLLDFDYHDRSVDGEAEAEYKVNGKPVTNDLPEPDARDGAGPIIFVQE